MGYAGHTREGLGESWSDPPDRLRALLGRLALEDGAELPRRAQVAQQDRIRTVVAGDLRGEAEADRRCEEQRVSGGRAGHHVIEVHSGAEEGGDAGEEPDDEGDADQPLAVGDELAEPDVGLVV